MYTLFYVTAITPDLDFINKSFTTYTRARAFVDELVKKGYSDVKIKRKTSF